MGFIWPFLIDCIISENFDKMLSLVVEASTSGTRLSIFEWGLTNGHLKVPSIASKFSIKDTITADDLQFNLNGLFAKALEDPLLGQFKNQWRNFPVFLFATAVARTLDQSSKKTLIKNLINYLSTLQFNFREENLKILTGEEEAAFGWTSANLLKSSMTVFDPKVLKTESVGWLDLGGGSFEVSFLPPPNTLVENSFNLIFKYEEFSLYAKSFQHFGLYDAFRRATAAVAAENHPCLNNDVQVSDLNLMAKNDPKVTLKGLFDFPNCMAVISSLFQRDPSLCLTGRCSFNGVYQPKLEGVVFLPAPNISQFITRVLGLSGKTSLEDVKKSSTKICSLEGVTLKAQFPSYEDGEIFLFCFKGLFIFSLFVNGLGMDANSDGVLDLLFADHGELDWTLGALLYEQLNFHYIKNLEDEVKAASKVTSSVFSEIKAHKLNRKLLLGQF